MKNIKITSVLLSLAMATGMNAFAQVHANDNLWYNNGAQLYIGATALLTVQGDVTNNQATVTGITHLNNNGFIWVQGNLYGDNAFMQAGTGTLRLQNKTSLYTAPYSTENYQVIQGGYKVNGGKAKIGATDDGSFYNLELDNQNGQVYIKDNTDVRNSIDFQPASVSVDGNTIAPNGTINRILTYDPGTGSSAASAPANGASYTATFGMMNSAAGLTNFKNLSTNLTTNTTTLDNAYIQGKLRRALDATTGGSYGFPLGLEPSTSSTAARGIQYAQLDFTANSYDVLTGYFQQGSDNTITPAPTSVCSITGGFSYYGSTNHGEWIFTPQTVASDAYNLTIYPQDYGILSSTKYFITKDNAVPSPGTESCATSPAGLSVTGIAGFSAFGIAGGSMILPIKLQSFTYTSNQCNGTLNWVTSTEQNVSRFEIEQSSNGNSWMLNSTVAAAGNSSTAKSYTQAVALQPNTPNYYRLKMIDLDGGFTYSYIISMNCSNEASIVMSPNPTKGMLFINGLPNGAKTVIVYNALGQELTRKAILFSPASIDFSRYSEGVYTVKVLSENGEVLQTQKVIK